ncbi:MAG: integrase core domain-containing protein [Burkholderia sp.]
MTARSTGRTISAPRSSSGGLRRAAFVAEPQTHGVAERFNRTMKAQAIHERLFNHVEKVRAAAIAFKDRYNREWRLEKTGLQVPPRSPSGSALDTCRLIAKSCLNNRIRYTLRP